MSVIGGQNIPAINSLAYVIDFGNQRSYSSGSNTVSSVVYSSTIGWAAQAPNIQANVPLGATGRQYDTPGSASRAILTSAPYNWTITGDTYVP